MAKQGAEKTYAYLKEYWRLEHLKMKRTNPTAKQYEFGMNAATDTTTIGDGTDIATILE